MVYCFDRSVLHDNYPLLRALGQSVSHVDLSLAHLYRHVPRTTGSPPTGRTARWPVARACAIATSTARFVGWAPALVRMDSWFSIVLISVSSASDKCEDFLVHRRTTVQNLLICSEKPLGEFNYYSCKLLRSASSSIATVVLRSQIYCAL